MMNIDTYGLLDIHPDHLLGQSVAVLGTKGSGKSNTAAVLMEEMLAAGIPICVVDIAGEYWTLKKEFPHVTVVGRSLYAPVEIALTMSNEAEIAELAYTNGKSVVLDLSGFDPESRTEVLSGWFGRIWFLAARHRIPCVIFLEEAHNFMPQSKKTAVSDLFVNIAAEGRKRGLSLIMVGQRSARIDKDTLSQADIAFLHRVRHPADMKVYAGLIPRSSRQVQQMVNALKVGEALVLRGDSIIRCAIRLRKTEHVGYTPTLDAVPKNVAPTLASMVSSKYD